jgi:hypothetical protein
VSGPREMYEMLPWRVGRSVGRTIYAQLGPLPTRADELIGVMNTPALAAEAVECHNERLQSEGSRA